MVKLLTGAVIYPKENPTIGITTNSYGYFSLTLPDGEIFINSSVHGI